jgi:DNA-binding MarR family transcriptional regulator
MSDIGTTAKKIQAECLYTRTRQLVRLLSRIYDEAMAPVGLEGTQFTVMIGVSRFGDGGAPISKLAEKLVMDRTTLTRNIGPLEKGGFLRVARDPQDARVRVLLLTRKGERAVADGGRCWEQAQDIVKARLGIARTERLAAELDAARDALGAGDVR